MEEIIVAIQNVSLIITYLIPGIIFLETIKRRTDAHIEHNLIYIVCAVTISYLLKYILHLIHIAVFQSYSFSAEEKFCISSIFAFFIAVIICSIYYREWFKNIINKISLKPIHSNIWVDLIDFEAGCTVGLVMKNGTLVSGCVFEIEENGNDSWIALSNYVCESHTDETAVFECKSKGLGARTVILIRVADIAQAQIVYNYEDEKDRK